MYHFTVRWYDSLSGCEITKEVALDNDAIIDMALEHVQETPIFEIVRDLIGAVTLD